MGAFLSQESVEAQFSGLPVELIGNIISLLPPCDVASLRLMSKAFAVMGRRGLFNGRLTLRIYRDDMRRLTGIGGCPWLAACIQEIEIFVAEVDCHHFDYQPRGEIDEDTLAELQCVWRFLEVNRSGLFCLEGLLATAFPSFTHVNSIVVTSRKFPFGFITQSDSLRPAWRHIIETAEDPSHLNSHRPRYKESTARFPNLVLAARAYLPPLTKLVFDPFPIEALIRRNLTSMEGAKTSMMTEMIKLCNRLQHLQIAIDGHSDGRYYDGPSIGRAMSKFLGSLYYLRTLELSFPLARFTTPGYIDHIFGIYLPCLRTFKLEKIGAPPDVLLSFLIRHNATLRELRLSSTALCVHTGDSFKDFITALRDSLRLEKFEMFNWDSKEETLYVEERCQDPGEMSRRLEQYVKGEGSWCSGAELAFSNARIVQNPLEGHETHVQVIEPDQD